MTDSCPCGSGKSYSQCCEPYLTDMAQPDTAESLMRSRYTAYTRKDSAYLYKTWHALTQPTSINLDDDEMQWDRLEVIRTEAGSVDDQDGVVEFIAHFTIDGQSGQLHEISEFTKESGIWFYKDGASPQPKTVHKLNNTGRNEPCPCGSGKKYKKCCMA
ncbi:MAG: SEC-C domain-containing protein [Proteobacteria bacterium]|nr:SEC-C domain-containing protein [Pseudomonadota bacterium]